MNGIDVYLFKKLGQLHLFMRTQSHPIDPSINIRIVMRYLKNQIGPKMELNI